MEDDLADVFRSKLREVRDASRSVNEMLGALTRVQDDLQRSGQLASESLGELVELSKNSATSVDYIGRAAALLAELRDQSAPAIAASAASMQKLREEVDLLEERLRSVAERLDASAITRQVDEGIRSASAAIESSINRAVAAANERLSAVADQVDVSAMLLEVERAASRVTALLKESAEHAHKTSDALGVPEQLTKEVDRLKVVTAALAVLSERQTNDGDSAGLDARVDTVVPAALLSVGLGFWLTNGDPKVSVALPASFVTIALCGLSVRVCKGWFEKLRDALRESSPN